MCVACGQFTGSSSSKTQTMGRPAFFKGVKFLKWTSTMRAGSITDPRLLLVPAPTPKETHTCRVRGACAGCLQRTGAAGWAAHCSTAGQQPFKHTHARTREKVSQDVKGQPAHHTQIFSVEEQFLQHKRICLPCAL